MHFLAETPEPKRAHGMEVVVYVILSLHLLSCSVITACVTALIIAHMPPIVTCFFHAHVHSRFTTDREVFVRCTCRLISSPPIVMCYFLYMLTPASPPIVKGGLHCLSQFHPDNCLTLLIVPSLMPKGVMVTSNLGSAKTRSLRAIQRLASFPLARVLNATGHPIAVQRLSRLRLLALILNAKTLSTQPRTKVGSVKTGVVAKRG